MPTDRQLRADRANAQKSTGPRTAEGKSRAASNAATHALSANPTTLFAAHPHERTQYNQLKQKLLVHLRPEGELERDLFEQYVFALFQSSRARRYESAALTAWTSEPTNPKLFRQILRIQQLGSTHERRADRILNRFRQQQMDRFTSLDVANELFALDQFIPIPAALPLAAMRQADSQRTNPFTVATQLMTNKPKPMRILRGEQPMEPQPWIHLTPDQLDRFSQTSRR